MYILFSQFRNFRRSECCDLFLILNKSTRSHSTLKSLQRRGRHNSVLPLGNISDGLQASTRISADSCLPLLLLPVSLTASDTHTVVTPRLWPTDFATAAKMAPTRRRGDRGVNTARKQPEPEPPGPQSFNGLVLALLGGNSRSRSENTEVSSEV